MPIAKYQLPDGRIGRFEVREGTTPEQAVALIQQSIAANPELYAAKAEPQTPSAPESIPQRARRAVEQAARSDVATGLAQAGGVAARGVLGLPAMITQAGQEAWNLTAPAQSWLANLVGFGNVTPQDIAVAPENMALNNLYALTTRAGEPSGGRLVEGAIGALTGAGGARAVASVAKSPVLRNMAETLGRNRTLQAASGASAAGASEVAKEYGAGPLGQLVAGVAGGFAPGAAITGVRSAVVKAPEEMAARQAQFERAGVQTPTLGQVTQQKSLQAIEGGISKAPGAVSRMETIRASQQEDLARKVDQLADRLSPVVSTERAGEIIDNGLTGKGGFVDRFQDAQRVAYNKVDQLVPKDMPVSPSATTKVLTEMSTPVKGAESTTGALVSPVIARLRDSIQADLQQSASGAMPYEALAKLRTMVGAKINDSAMVSDAPISQLKRLYGALSEDMETAIRNTGDPKAITAFERANRLTRAGHARIENILQSVTSKKVPEAVYNSATNAADMRVGASKIRTVLKSLKPAEADVVRAMVLRRLGNALPGKQNAEGDAFSSETFLTNWAKLSPEAKSALYGNNTFRKDLDAIAKTAADIRQSNAIMGNPSGTAQNVAPYAIGTSALTALGTGHFLGAALISLEPFVANATSRLMTNPSFIRWLGGTIRNRNATSMAAALQSLPEMMRDEPESVRKEAEDYMNRIQGQENAALP